VGDGAVSANLVGALSALVEVLDVSLSEVDSDQLQGRGLDAPQAGNKSSTYALDVEGWVRGHRPIEKMRLTCGDLLWRAPIRKEEERFRTAVGTLRLPPEFELLVSAPLGGGEAADVATIRGRRARLSMETEPRLQPLVVSSFGRSGSTAVTRMLEALPSVIAYGTYRREPSVAAYWVSVLTALAEPASYRSQMIQAITLGNWWLGGEAAPQPFDPEPVQQLIGVDAIRSLAAFCGSRIAAFYEPLAAEQGGSDVRYFIEKYPPARVPEVMWDLYPGAREIIVIRDFRDMAASMLAFGSKKGPIRTDFGRHADRSDADFVRRLGDTVSLLDGYRRRRGDNALVLRYEDLVQRPEEAIAGLLRYLDLDASAENVALVHEAFFARSETSDAHRTTADLEASIGRWQRDFDADLRDVCREAFGPALTAFGYGD
jgi:hypothetical protein